MHMLLIVAALSLAGILSAHAGTHNIPKVEPLATVTIPDQCTTEPYMEGEGVEANSEDGEVYLAIETTASEGVEDAIKDAAEYLAGKGVSFDDKSMKQSKRKINEMDAEEVSWDGEDDEGPTKIGVAVVSVTSEKGVLLIYWSSPEGAEKNREAIDKIVTSITKAGA